MSCPDYLDAIGRAKWEELWQRGTYADHELDSLAAYCAAYQRFVAAERWLLDPEHSCIMTICDDKGNVKSHGVVPQVALSERAAKEMGRLSKLLRLGHRRTAAAPVGSSEDDGLDLNF